MFGVSWSRRADGQLAELWIGADDRSAITAAVDSIDRQLRSGARTLGESRGGPERVAFVPPLVVRFQVIEADRLDVVLGVRHVRRRNP